MEFIKHYAWCLYLGIALSHFADVNFCNWRFYAISVPVVLLVEWRISG